MATQERNGDLVMEWVVPVIGGVLICATLNPGFWRGVLLILGLQLLCRRP